MFVKFTKQQKDRIIADIQNFFLEERNEEIGELAAENVLEFFKKNLGPYFYNEGIKDARNVLEQKLNSIEEDLYSLEKNTDR